MDREALVIGLDGATWDILRPAIDQGYLPTLESMIDDGFHGDMESTLPPITPVAWTSFMTGVNPGKHGISGFAQPSYNGNEYKFSLNDSQDISTNTIWEYLSERGRSIVSLNLPMTYPPFEVNGALISGLMTPNERQQFTHPPELQDELLKQDFKPFIKHVAGKLSGCESKDEYRQRVDEMCKLVEKKFGQAYYIDDQQDWDVFFMQIQETDAIQHFLMGFYEEGHGWYDEEMTEYIYENFYGVIDQRLGEMIETVGEDALTIVLSDHGFQTCDRVVYLGNWLRDEGFAEPSTKGVLYKSTIDTIKKLDILGLRRHLKSGRKIAKQKESFTVDWSKSDAISIGAGNNPIAPIYILAEGDRRDNIQDKLVQELKEFTDPKTGERVVEEVIIGDDVYSGRYSDEMPDVLIKGRPGYTFRTTFHSEDPTIVDLLEKTDRPGVHHRSGMFMGTSPDTKSGGYQVNGDLIDLFPTLVYYLGEPIPNYLDGTVLDIFTDEFRNEVEEKWSEIPSDRDAEISHVYSEEDEEDLKDTLSQLGYID